MRRFQSAVQAKRLFGGVFLLLTWTLFISKAAMAQCPLIAIDPKVPNTLFLGLSDAGIFKSTNGGTTWELSGLRGAPLSELAISPKNPMILYAGTYYGVMKSTDGGKSWKESGLPESNIDRRTRTDRMASDSLAAERIENIRQRTVQVDYGEIELSNEVGEGSQRN